jgi:hypothetical protein
VVKDLHLICYYVARAEVIEDVVYSTALKMRKSLTGEILDLDVPFFRPMLRPGKDGNPLVRFFFCFLILVEN